MTHPAEHARTHIMAALEACQSDPSLADTLGMLTEHLAKAQKKLFPASNIEPQSPACIDMMRRAMDSLAQALKILQDIDSDAEAVGIAAASIAQSLKTLHPAVQEAKEKASRNTRPPEPDTASVNVNTMLSMNTDHQFFNGFSDNIEEGGIFVSTFEPKPKGSEVVINFKLPGNRAVSAKGIVQFVREYNPMVPDTAPGMGVKFTALMPSDKKAIEEFMQSRTAMFYDE
ncbi:MAG: PilZ domain-containing protein [Deltaproteobacteria bacterium]|nr:PilZ domain-containing protein [Deltaproteobacteria bacterium]